MPKKNDKSRQVRIRSAESEYIEEVAAKLNTTYLDALYYIIAQHRGVVRGLPNMQPSPSNTQIHQEPESINDDDFDMDTSQFEC